MESVSLEAWHGYIHVCIPTNCNLVSCSTRILLLLLYFFYDESPVHLWPLIAILCQTLPVENNQFAVTCIYIYSPSVKRYNDASVSQWRSHVCILRERETAKLRVFKARCIKSHDRFSACFYWSRRLFIWDCVCLASRLEAEHPPSSRLTVLLPSLL